MGRFNFLNLKKHASKNEEKSDKSILAARKYGENIIDNASSETSILAAKKYGENVGLVKETQNNEYKENLGLLELSEINWSEFGAKLKQEKLLPPSYDRHPTSVKFSLSKSKRPIAEIVYNSKTSDSYRKIMIYDGDKIFEFTNGVQNMPTRETMVSVWQDFKRAQRLRINMNKKSESINIKLKANHMKKTAEAMLNIDQLFEDEREFLNTHKDDVYDFFGYMLDEDNEIPFFVTTSDQSDDEFGVEEMVTPFSPKTLEFCVSRLTDEEKYNLAKDEISMQEFVKKCKNLSSKAIYETDKWDKTIDLLTKTLKNFAEENFVE